MAELIRFLDNYSTVIFDMDGVITSEQNYWNSAALTVYELLNSSAYFGNGEIDADSYMKNRTAMRAELFSGDKLIELLKNKGVNSNWDLAYVVICIAAIRADVNPDVIYSHAQMLSDNILDDYDTLASETAAALNKPVDYCRRNGKLWLLAHYCFQEWFLGDGLFYKIYGRLPKKCGKQGLVYRENPIIPLESLRKIFSLMKESGKRICMGTGRPADEILPPLEKWDVKKYMDENALINYNHVTDAEKKLGGHFTKPHPFMFLKAMLGESFPDEKIINGDYPKEDIKSTLVVGDAGADIFAAKAMGADFCAVLTGVSGEAARPFFEEQNARYILGSVEDFLM